MKNNVKYGWAVGCALITWMGSMSHLGAAGIAGPRYVIMMIGDGMGWPQVQLAEMYRGAEEGQLRRRLQMSELPVIGVVRTHSASDVVTDSGAGGTALACGIKTRNGYVGVDTNGVKYASVATLAKCAGRKVGIVTTDSLVGATPAVFYAHRADRWSTYPIAVDLFRSGFDLFVAAGDFDDPAGKNISTNGLCALTNELWELVVPGNPATNPSGVTWVDVRSLTSRYGYTWISTVDEWRAAKPSDEKRIAVLDIAYGIERTGALSLAAVTRRALELVDSPSGFFLMVEGARIDKCGHANDAAGNVFETLAFDEAVSEAYQFLRQRPEETLLLVTADHETGGMTLGHGANRVLVLRRQAGLGVGFEARFAHYKARHTTRGMLGRWWAAVVGGEDRGKERARFEDIKGLLREWFGFGEEAGDVVLTAEEWRRVEEAFRYSVGGKREYGEDDVFKVQYGGYDPLTITAVRLLGDRAGVRWSTVDHSAADVPLFAAGVGSVWFGGMHDNTDVPRLIMKVMLPGKAFPACEE